MSCWFFLMSASFSMTVITRRLVSFISPFAKDRNSLLLTLLAAAPVAVIDGDDEEEDISLKAARCRGRLHRCRSTIIMDLRWPSFS